jgi:hypothetical protein
MKEVPALDKLRLLCEWPGEWPTDDGGVVERLLTVECALCLNCRDIGESPEDPELDGRLFGRKSILFSSLLCLELEGRLFGRKSILFSSLHCLELESEGILSLSKTKSKVGTVVDLPISSGRPISKLEEDWFEDALELKVKERRVR